MEYYNLDQEKIRDLLSKSTWHRERTIVNLCEVMGISFPTFWRRCKHKKWKLEQVVAVGFAMGKILKCDPIHPDKIIS